MATKETPVRNNPAGFGKPEKGKRTTFLENEEQREGLAVGRNAVYEALSTGANIDKIYVLGDDHDQVMKRIMGMAKEKKIPVQVTDRFKLRKLTGTDSHQGVACCIAETQYCEIADIIKKAQDEGHPPFVVVCDEITDPHNLGAIIRTALAAGVDGVIIPRRRGVGITPSVSKASAGAVFQMAIAKVNNITAALEELKEAGLWIYGLDGAGDAKLFETKLGGALALVVGSEGDGISRLVREHCDVVVSIPMEHGFNSLNASVATGIALFEVVRQRQLKQ